MYQLFEVPIFNVVQPCHSIEKGRSKEKGQICGNSFHLSRRLFFLRRCLRKTRKNSTKSGNLKQLVIVCHGALDEIGNRGANLAGGFGDVDDEERVDEEKKNEDVTLLC